MADAKQPRVLVISGGSRGLGLALVRHFLSGGDAVATFSRSRTEATDELAADGRTGPRFLYQSVDGTDSAGVQRFVAAVGERFGRLDGLVNNAGIARDGVIATMADQAIRQVIEVNLVGSLLLTRECVRQMLLGGGGRIVNVSSIIGLRGYAGLSVYTATKAGLIGATASLARELGGRNITVNAVAPGYLQTEMTGELTARQKEQIVRRTPLGRLGTPQDVIGAVEFLLSDAAAYITGQTLAIDGGISC